MHIAMQRNKKMYGVLQRISGMYHGLERMFYYVLQMTGDVHVMKQRICRAYSKVLDRYWNRCQVLKRCIQSLKCLERYISCCNGKGWYTVCCKWLEMMMSWCKGQEFNIVHKIIALVMEQLQMVREVHIVI